MRSWTSHLPTAFAGVAAGCWVFLYTYALLLPTPRYESWFAFVVGKLLGALLSSFVLYTLGFIIIVPVWLITLPIVVALATMLSRAAARDAEFGRWWLWAASGAITAALLGYVTRSILEFELRAWLIGNAVAGATAMTIVWRRSGRNQVSDPVIPNR